MITASRLLELEHCGCTEIEDLENTLERTEKGVVFLKGLLNNISEQNKIYKTQFTKFKKIFGQEQYVFFIFITVLYCYSIYIIVRIIRRCLEIVVLISFSFLAGADIILHT